MRSRPRTTFACSWLLLAAWLALWPAAESPQAIAREHAMMARSLVSTAGCCRAQARDVPDEPAPGRGCCSRRSESPARPPSCPEGGASRCAQCFGYAALLMFANAQATLEPERPVLGAIRHGDHVAASRDLRPPVPPPRTAIATA